MILVRTFRIKNYPYKHIRALAETLARRECTRRGWIVFRASYFGWEGRPRYSRARVKYELLEELFIQTTSKETFHTFRAYCLMWHGEPDFVVYDASVNRLFFVEIKYKNEAIKKHQLRCMREIVRMGVSCEVWRFIDATMRKREEIIELPDFLPADVRYHKRVMKKEMSLMKFV